mmetsp:Transcript_9928/g.20228  ORF Transcript_9928/g.20228 Transcript_9928/m.20228 type:complete len:218 (+) Transcript_9928:161-814(+)
MSFPPLGARTGGFMGPGIFPPPAMPIPGLPMFPLGALKGAAGFFSGCSRLSVPAKGSLAAAAAARSNAPPPDDADAGWGSGVMSDSRRSVVEGAAAAAAAEGFESSDGSEEVGGGSGGVGRGSSERRARSLSFTFSVCMKTSSLKAPSVPAWISSTTRGLHASRKPITARRTSSPLSMPPCSFLIISARSILSDSEFKSLATFALAATDMMVEIVAD